MRSRKRLNRRKAVAAPTGDYAVGYCRPPAEHRFRKGQSGNIRGSARVAPTAALVPRLPADTLHEMVLAEANRMVRVRVGRRQVEIPAMQAAFREAAMQAAQGDRLAMEAMARLVRRAEKQAPPAAAAPLPLPARLPHVPATAMEAAAEYKRVWTDLLRAAARGGVAVAPPVPHPDAVTIGYVAGTANWPGAEEGEMLSLDGLSAMHAWWSETLPRERATIEALPEGYDKAAALCDWFARDDARRLVEYYLPERYREAIEAEAVSSEQAYRDRALRTVAEAEFEEAQREAATDAQTSRGGDAADAGPDAVEPSPAPAAPPAPTPEAMAQVAEASLYCRAWGQAIAEARRAGIRTECPNPHPDTVTIDAAAGTVTYATPQPPDGGATLDALRGGIARLKAGVAREDVMIAQWRGYREEIAARRRREDLVRVCAVLERVLGAG